MERPLNEEYSAHFESYVRLVPDGNVIDLLAERQGETGTLIGELTEEQGDYRYAPGKWSLKEVIGHLTDTERIMSYRLLRIARGDRTPLAGFDENEFVKGASFSLRSLPELLEEYVAVRRATLTLLRGLTEEAWVRTGIANGSETSARALAYIIAGHELHHLQIIRERYLA